MPTTINIPMANGLHPTGTESRASKWFRLFEGLRLTPFGAEPWPTLSAQTLPGTYEVNTSWGCVRRDGQLLLAQRSGTHGVLYDINGALSAYNVATWDLTRDWVPASTRQPVRWHIADMNGTWFLFDGAGGTYFQSAHNARVWYAYYGQKAGLAHRGRLILGGFDPTYAWYYTQWNTFFDTHKSQLPAPYSALAQAIPGANWVWWSSAGADDALFWYNKTHLNSTILDLLSMGTSGMAVMPWSGAVVRILSAPNGFTVYGSNGATFMRDVESPTPGFGMQPLAGWPEGQGVLAVDGDERGHLAVATDGNVWFVADNQAERREFKYLFSGATPSVIKDPLHGGWFIGPDVYGEWTYFDDQGNLVRVNQRPSAVYLKDGVWTGVMPTVTPNLDIITDTYPITGGGVVAAVKLHGSWANDTEVSVLYRDRGTWEETESVAPDSRGLVLFNAPAHQFRVRVYGDTTAGVKLERLEVFLGGLTADGNPSLRTVL
jgi:hypothetical protein